MFWVLKWLFFWRFTTILHKKYDFKKSCQNSHAMTCADRWKDDL